MKDAAERKTASLYDIIMTPEGNNTSEPEPEPVRASTEERPKVVDQESAHGERTFDGRDHVELRQELQSPVIM